MSLVMDSRALLALLRHEDGAEEVRDLLLENPCFVHAINMCEVYYGFRRDAGEGTAQSMVKDVTALGVTIREDMDADFWQAAGQYKADLARISLADCFCAALANRLDADVVTTDRHELGKVTEQGLCRVRFVR